MKSEAGTSLGTIGVLLGGLFVLLKLTHIIAWSWFWVTLPFWVWIPLVGLVWIFILIFLGILALIVTGKDG